MRLQSFLNLARRLYRGPARYRETLQLTSTGCGAACLAMILEHFGRIVQLSELRCTIGSSRNGVSAGDIIRGAAKYGLDGRGVRVGVAMVPELPLPVIAHWEHNHFVVVERCRRGCVDVVDPMRGRQRLSEQEFTAGFTGVIVVAEPGPDFQPGGEHPQRWRRYLRTVLEGRRTLAGVFTVSLLLQLFGFGLPVLTASLVDWVVPNRRGDVLVMIMVGALVLLAIRGVVSYARSRLLITLQVRLDRRMMVRFFRHLLSLPCAFFMERSTGDLLMRLNANSIVRDVLSTQVLSVLLDGLLVVVYLLVLAIHEIRFASVALALGAAHLALACLSIRMVRQLVQRDVRSQARTQSYLVEALRGIASIKVSGAEDRVFENWWGLFDAQLQASIAQQRMTALMEGLHGALNWASPLILLVVGVTLVFDGSVTLGSMLGAVGLASAFLVPLITLARSLQRFEFVDTHFRRLDDVLDSPRESPGDAAGCEMQISGAVSVERLSFRHAATDPFVLSDISFAIEPGQFAAIVGPTGSGKSTLLALLCGLLKPTSGVIRYDGANLPLLNGRTVRSQIGVVLQDSFLFNDTIHRNIALHDPSIPLIEVRNAATLAGIADEIEALPLQYDTLVSELGSNFSGGQRQRIILARALVCRPRLLLLDEATNQLDSETESQIMDRLGALDCSRLVVAHRLGTIRQADVVFVLEAGKLTESGRHDELVLRNGSYARIMSRQVG